MTHIRSGLAGLQLGQLLDVMTNSDRIVIHDGSNSNSPVIYKGYVACLDYLERNIDCRRRVLGVGIGATFYTVDKAKLNKFSHTQPLDEEITAEQAGRYDFKDLVEFVYTNIYLGGMT